jgi:glucose/arabinose dehydrogenase
LAVRLYRQAPVAFANLAPDKVEASITPDLLFQAHSSLLDLVFYEGDQFPTEYKGSLFVALNQQTPIQVAELRFTLHHVATETTEETHASGVRQPG